MLSANAIITMTIFFEILANDEKTESLVSDKEYRKIFRERKAAEKQYEEAEKKLFLSQDAEFVEGTYNNPENYSKLAHDAKAHVNSNIHRLYEENKQAA